MERFLKNIYAVDKLFTGATSLHAAIHILMC